MKQNKNIIQVNQMVNIGLNHFLQNGRLYWSCVYNEDHGSVFKQGNFVGWLFIQGLTQSTVLCMKWALHIL